METVERINELERRQLELRATMQKSDEHALKCFKSNLDFRTMYPEEWNEYEAAREEYNVNEEQLKSLYEQWESEKEKEAEMPPAE